jgi:putative lipoprotein
VAGAGLALAVALFAGLLFGRLAWPLLWQDEGETAMFARRVLEYGYPKVHDEGNVVYQFAFDVAQGEGQAHEKGLAPQVSRAFREGRAAEGAALQVVFMRTSLAAGVAWLTLTGPMLSGAEPLATTVWQCGEERVVTHREASGELTVFLREGTQRLAQVPSESGARHEGDGVAFWSQGEGARLTVSGASRPCRADRRASIWEDAKLRGVDFRAVGNEPGWHLEIGPEAILLVTDYGAETLRFPRPQPESDAESRRTLYACAAEGRELRVQLEGRPCRDTMSDEAFETSVEVQLAGRRLKGCGRALH